MNTITEIRASPGLPARWRGQVARQRRCREAAGPRHLAGIGYLVNGPIYDHLVDVRRLVIVVVHDQLRNGRLATRVAGYTAASLPWGLKIGGRESNRFEKDLLRAPVQGGCGQRLNLDQPELLALALQLDRQLTRHAKHPHMPGRWKPRWPQFWATFEPETALGLQGDGPEFEALLRRHPRSDLRSQERAVLRMPAFPLEFASHAWQRCVMVMADLGTMPKRQVIGAQPLARSLCGFSGAIEYDLVHSRFSSAADRV